MTQAYISRQAGGPLASSQTLHSLHSTVSETCSYVCGRESVRSKGGCIRRLYLVVRTEIWLCFKTLVICGTLSNTHSILLYTCLNGLHVRKDISFVPLPQVSQRLYLCVHMCASDHKLSPALLASVPAEAVPVQLVSDRTHSVLFDLCKIISLVTQA